MTITDLVTINSKNYFELEISADEQCLIFRNKEYIREEGGKIYRLSRDQSTELLMIDFNETSSYSIEYEHIWGGSGIVTSTAIIDSFGFENINNQSVKTQYLKLPFDQFPEDTMHLKVYEKIGFSYFLFPNVSTGLCDVFDYYNSPRCFISNQDTIYFTEFNCYESSISTGIHEIDDEDFNLYPNPTTQFIHIPEEFEFMQIINANGQDYKPIISNNIINLKSIPDGIYFLQVLSKTKDNISTHQIVKSSI